MPQTSKARTCLFCGSSGLTREHVYPSWIFDLLPPQAGNFDVQLIPVDVTQDPLAPFEPVWTGHRPPKDNFTLRLFCRDCNSGWMAAAEARAKAVIGAELSSHGALPQLSQEDSHWLAHWAVLKVIVGLAHLKIVLDPRVHYEIRRGRIPPGVYVEVARASSLALNSCYTPFMVWKAREVERAVVGELAAQSLIGAVQIGTMMFRVSIVPPHERIRRVRVNFQTEVLHPYQAEVAYEQYPLASDGDEKLELPVFTASLGLMDFPEVPGSMT